MNIALVHDWITNVAGAERVILEINKFYPKAPIYTSVFDSEKAAPFKKLDVRPSFLQKFPLLKSKRELLIPITPFAFEQIDLSTYDLVISNTTMAAKGVLTKPDTVHVCYCHTPSRYLWEPEIDPRASKGRFSFLRKYVAKKMRTWDLAAADRVDYFLANSKYIAGRIKKIYGREAIVVYPPVDVERFKPVDKKEVGDYFLFVSRLIPYKKCDIIIEAFNKLGLPLKIIGRGPEKKRLQKMAGPNIEFLGFLTDTEVNDYYAKAKAFVFAADEDFGIVPVEAMAAGRPVIAYGKGGLLETVIEGKTGIFFDKQTPESIVQAVKKFDLEKFDSQIIRKHSEQFSNARFQREFTDTINVILEKEGKK